MPVVFVCSNCGRILYVFKRAGQDYYGIPTPSELASRIGGVCPYCGKPISLKVSLRNVFIRIRGSSPLRLREDVSVNEGVKPFSKFV